MKKNKFEFIIDSEFQSQIPALTDEEFQQLEENILSEGEVLSPLIVWGNILVDGHNRYKILQQHPEIPYTTRSISCTCETREDVLAWICKHQLGRRNLTPEQKKFLIGKQYHSEKSTRGGNHGNQYTQVANCQIDNLPPVENTTERIAKENNVSPSFVIRAEQFMKTVELMEKYCPGIQEEILSGKLKLSQREATIIRGTPTEALPTVVSTWREEKLNGKPDDSADTYEIQNCFPRSPKTIFLLPPYRRSKRLIHSRRIDLLFHREGAALNSRPFVSQEKRWQRLIRSWK